MGDKGTFVPVVRFRILEALLEEYSAVMPREVARERLSRLRARGAVRQAALDWFDLRWPESEAK